jgi:hypothetical protein
MTLTAPHAIRVDFAFNPRKSVRRPCHSTHWKPIGSYSKQERRAVLVRSGRPWVSISDTSAAVRDRSRPPLHSAPPRPRLSASAVAAGNGHRTGKDRRNRVVGAAYRANHKRYVARGRDCKQRAIRGTAESAL